MRTIGWMGAAWLALATTMAVATIAGAGAANAADKPVKFAQQLEPGDFSAAYKACIDKADGSDYALSDCNAQERDRQDKALNQVYRELAAKLEPPRRASLLTAERAWMAYRDAECAQEQSGEEGGTLAKVIVSECLLNMIYDRVQALKRQLSQETF